MSSTLAAGTVLLPYLGEAIIISLKMMLFVDSLLLGGYHVTPAEKQLLLTCPAPAAAPTPASVATQDLTQEAEPAFSRWVLLRSVLKTSGGRVLQELLCCQPFGAAYAMPDGHLW